MRHDISVSDQDSFKKYIVLVHRNDAEVALAADGSVQADWGMLRWRSRPRYRPQQPKIVKITDNPMLEITQCKMLCGAVGDSKEP